MKNKTKYKILWDNGHATDCFPKTWTNKKKAIEFARNWKKEMVLIDKNPKEAREVYQWEIIVDK